MFGEIIRELNLRVLYWEIKGEYLKCKSEVITLKGSFKNMKIQRVLK